MLFESVEVLGGLNQIQITFHKEMTFLNITTSCDFWKLPFGTDMYFCFLKQKNHLVGQWAIRDDSVSVSKVGSVTFNDRG